MRAGSDDDFKHAVPVRVLGGELDFVLESEVVSVGAECDGVCAVHKVQKAIRSSGARDYQSYVDDAAGIFSCVQLLRAAVIVKIHIEDVAAVQALGHYVDIRVEHRIRQPVLLACVFE